ncbi:hypothetical protein R3P38DRAFT_2762010 [Favolaschia claudopus]|uniref:Zinc finger GRF-type domain-containing protein n=1 Tax=Favolaschia claudopus TaxID=2862362 RepID=A0AAW0DRF4_9AGAR
MDAEPPPPRPGTLCPTCERGTILFALKCTGRNNINNKGTYFIKCSRNYNEKDSPHWLTSQAAENKCSAFWWLANTTGYLKCQPKYIQSLSVECLHETADLSPSHTQLRFLPPQTPTSVVERLDVSTVSNAVPTTPLPGPSPTYFPIHGGNVSSYFQQALPTGFIEQSLSQSATASASKTRTQYTQATNHQIRVGWCKDVDGPPVYINVSAPDIPHFHPATSNPIIRLSGLDKESLQSFCFFQGGFWAGGDLPLHSLRPLQTVLLGPFEHIGQQSVKLSTSTSTTIPETPPTPTPTLPRMTLKRGGEENPSPSKKSKHQSLAPVTDAVRDDIIEISDSDEDRGAESAAKEDVFGPVIMKMCSCSDSNANSKPRQNPSFPGVYAVDVDKYFREVIEMTKTGKTKIGDALLHVYRVSVPNSTWYRHREVWEARQTNIAVIVRQSINAGLTPEGRWEPVYNQGRKLLDQAKKKRTDVQSQ